MQWKPILHHSPMTCSSQHKSDHSQLRSATTNTPVVRVLEHSDPGRELEPPSHLTGHPGALPWQHASLRVRHDGQVTPILGAQTSQSARRPVGVEGIHVGGVAGIVHIVQSSQLAGLDLGVERLILEDEFTWKKNDFFQGVFLLLVWMYCGKDGRMGGRGWSMHLHC